MRSVILQLLSGGKRIAGQAAQHSRHALAGATAALVLALVPAAASAATPPSVLGTGTRADIVAGLNTKDNQVWFAAQDPTSRAKLFVNFSTTPGALGSPTPSILILGVVPNGNNTKTATNNWFYLPLPLVSGYTASLNPASLTSKLGSVAYDPFRDAYHLLIKDAPLFSADLWFTGPVGGSTLPAIWDAQTSFWTQSLGTGVVNGTITFPGSQTPTAVSSWGAEQETQFGSYELGGGIGGGVFSRSPHIGYYYGQADYPDGSASTLYVFPELDGTVRGILTHTAADGLTTECEPSQVGGVQVSNWHRDPVGFWYPLTVTSRCGGMSLTLTTTPSQSNVQTLSLIPGGFASSQSVASAAGASAAWLQHVADVGHFGPTG